MVFKIIVKRVFYFLFSIIFFVSSYMICEFLLSRVSNKYILSQDNSYEIFIKSNGVHTDIVLPIKSELINWLDMFNYKDTLSKKDDYRYISIGWGDKGFYLDTPTWSELKISTALKAGLGVGNAALHITYYENVLEDDLTYSINISKEQYGLIISKIKNSLHYKNDKPINIKTNAQYGQNDAFYEAIGSYSIFHTCNTWTNSALKDANLPSGVWVAFDDGILYQYEKVKRTMQKSNP